MNLRDLFEENYITMTDTIKDLNTQRDSPRLCTEDPVSSRCQFLPPGSTGSTQPQPQSHELLYGYGQTDSTVHRDR